MILILGFTESELTSIFVFQMQPFVEHPFSGEVLPLQEVYNNVIDFLGLTPQEDDNPFSDTWKKVEYRRELLGPMHIINASPEYWEYLMMIELQITPEKWRALSIDDRCKIRAARQIKGMLELVEHHWRTQEQKQKEANRGG